LGRTTSQPLPFPYVRPATRALHTSLPARRRSPVGRDPPARAPASSTRWPCSPTPTAPPCLTGLRPKRGRMMPPHLAPLFPPPSSLRAPHGQTPHRLPVCPTLGASPPLNSSRIAAAVHPLGEPPAAPIFHRSRPHLTSLSPPPPWCRARAPSSATTVLAPSPSTSTASCHAAPPMRRQFGEPHHRFPCPAHLPHRLHALALDPAARGASRAEPLLGRALGCEAATAC
jgi:hypothetical protein